MVKEDSIMRQFLSFDIGGTAIKYGVVNEKGEVLMHSEMDTHAAKGKDYILDAITRQSELLKEKYTINGIGISTAGVVDVFKGMTLHTTNVIKDYNNLPIKSILEDKVGLPVEINNDVNCFALCESKIGAASDVNDALIMTVGTGIGGGIIINNELYYGSNYAAGEWGLMQIPGGMYESIASMKSLVDKAKETLPPIKNGKALFEQYDQGNFDAHALIDTFYDHLALGLSNLIHTFNPGRIVIGGGISQRDDFTDNIMQKLKQYSRKEFLETLTLKPAKFRNLSGIIGAMFHFLDMEKKRNI